MANLGQLLGALLASLAHARRISDEETVAIAEYYKDHPLLEGMSVPRVRVSELTLELPMLVISHDEGTVPVLQDDEVIIQAVMEELEQQLAKRPSVKNAQKFINRFRANLESELAKIRRLERDNQRFQREHIVRVVDSAFAETLREARSTKIPPGQAKQILSNLKRVARDVAFVTESVPPTIEASIITPEVKDQASAGNVARLRITMKEEGVEWDIVDQPDGTRTRVLSPE